MSIARTGALPNEYRFVHIAVDDFENRLLRGRLYHDSRREGAAFTGLMEMVFVLEGLFEELHYPMKSVDHRNFDRKAPLDIREEALSVGTDFTGTEHQGALADFCLQVKYRYHATWQGQITDLRKKGSCSFSSLMELMDYLEKALGGGTSRENTGFGKKMCDVTVRSYENHRIGGDVSHPSVEDRYSFFNEFDLRDWINEFLNPVKEGNGTGTVIIPRTSQVRVGNFGPATFAVQILFRRNATWQGIISWREKRCQVSFRSFMEMLLLLQEAVGQPGEWQPQDGQDMRLA